MSVTILSSFCEGVAGAIREKEGSTALINPQDFVDRIKALEVGGGASGSKMRYFKVVDRLPSAGGGDIGAYSAMSQVVRYEGSRWSDDGSVKAMIETGSATLLNNGVYPIAFGFDPNTIVFDPRFHAEKTTLWEQLAHTLYYPATPEYPEKIDSSYFEEITEEQFYDLNTLLSE
jgi:hypothetical protein